MKFIFNYCCFLLLGLSTICLQAQSTCYDLLVLDKYTKLPIKDKSLSVEGGFVHAMTNDQGQARLCFDRELDSHTPLSINVEGVGFIRWDIKSNILLVGHEGLRLEEVTVLGVGGTYGNISRSSLQDEVISGRRLFNGNSSNIFQELAKFNGVRTMTQIPTSQNKIYLHGMTSNRLGIVVDGIRLENNQWGDDHGIDLNQQGIEKVEVIKTAQSLLYGSGAMGGVVNFVQREDQPNNSVWGNIYSQYGTNAGLIDNHIDLAARLYGITVGGYADGRISHDYHNSRDGYVLGSRYKQLNFGAHLFYQKKWGSFKLKFNQYHKILGLPNSDSRDSITGKFANSPWNKAYRYQSELLGDAREDWNETPSFMSTRQRNVSFVGKNNLSPHSNISYSINWQQNLRRELGAGHDHSHEDGNNHEAEHDHAQEGLSEHLRFNLQTLNYNFVFHHDTHQGDGIFSQDIAFSGGIQFSRMGGNEIFLPEYNQNYNGLVFVSDWKRRINSKNILDLSLGLRVDFTQIHTFDLIKNNKSFFSSINRNYWNSSSNFSVEYSYADHLKFNFTLGHAFRVPQVVELLANGSHEGTDRYEIGNLNLFPEQNIQFNLAGAYYSEHFYAKAEGYLNVVNNFMFLRKLIKGDGNDSIIQGSRAYKYQQATALIFGLDAELDIHPHPIDWLHFLNRFSIIYGRFEQQINDLTSHISSTELPRMAAPQWVSELRADLKTANKGPLRELNFSIESVYNFAQERYFAVYSTETATPQYWLLNAGLGFNFYVKNYNVCNLFVFASNLLDVAYQDHLNLLKYQGNSFKQGANTYRGIFNMGRNIGIKLHIPIKYRI